MSTSRIGLAELAQMGVSFNERELLFVTKHPEFRDLTPYLRGTFRTCQARQLVGRPIELDEAYEHYKGCDWCREHYEELVAPLKLALAAP